METRHQFVPDVVMTRKRNTGIWTCIYCGEHISSERALEVI